MVRLPFAAQPLECAGAPGPHHRRYRRAPLDVGYFPTASAGDRIKSQFFTILADKYDIIDKQLSKGAGLAFFSWLKPYSDPYEGSERKVQT